MEHDRKIVVIDDNPSLVYMISSALKLRGYMAFEAHDGFDGLQLVRKHQPDLILLDFDMPGLNGIDVFDRLRAAGDFTPVIVISVVPSKQAAWLAGGVATFVSKPFSLRDLLNIVEIVLRRSKEEPQAIRNLPSILRFATIELDIQAYIVKIGIRQLKLTAREFDLLAFFLRNPRRVLSRQQILNHVWGFEFEGESNIVDVYVGYLRKKLEAKREPQLIHTVRSVGYVLREDGKDVGEQ